MPQFFSVLQYARGKAVLFLDGWKDRILIVSFLGRIQVAPRKSTLERQVEGQSLIIRWVEWSGEGMIDGRSTGLVASEGDSFESRKVRKPAFPYFFLSATPIRSRRLAIRIFLFLSVKNIPLTP